MTRDVAPASLPAQGRQDFGRESPFPVRDPDPGIAPTLGPSMTVAQSVTWVPAGVNRWRAVRDTGAHMQSFAAADTPCPGHDPARPRKPSALLQTAYLPTTSTFLAGDNQPVAATLRQPHAIWTAGRRRGELDPSRTDVFQRGADGKLQPVPGWRTTGPFAVRDWSRMFDWGGVTADLTDIASGSIAFLEGGNLGGMILEGLGYKTGQHVIRGIIEGHHPWPIFVGGPTKQELARLFQSLHRDFHAELSAALKEAGFLRVGGRGGGTEDWAAFFRDNPGKREEALKILEDVTRSFDKRNGTKISKHLEDALGKGKTPPPSATQ